MTVAMAKFSRPKERLLSLDALRGLTIALMILVNDPGSWEHIYPPLRHAAWHGVTPTDLVFPFFLFIVGISIVLSRSSAPESHRVKAEIRRIIYIRAAKIFLLGMALGLLPYFEFGNLRWVGVLPRIAVVYLFCALLFMQGSKRLELSLFVMLLVGYWLAMTLVPVPDYGAGDLEPGRNLANWVDSRYLPGKLWRGSWDPEGLLSTLPALASGISGLLVGRFLISDMPRLNQISWLIVAGIIAVSAGLEWASPAREMAFPLNKNIWSSSYVLYSSGWASIVFAVLIYLMDEKGLHRLFTFAIIFGSNAITLYALSQVMMFTLDHGLGLRQIAFESLLGLGLVPEFASLVWATGFTAFCFMPAYVLYKKKIFIRL